MEVRPRLTGGMLLGALVSGASSQGARGTGLRRPGLSLAFNAFGNSNKVTAGGIPGGPFSIAGNVGCDVKTVTRTTTGIVREIEAAEQDSADAPQLASA